MSARPQMRGRAARLARLLPAGPASAARTPFVLLVVVLLGGGLIALLLLNSSLNQGSFRLSKLKKETTELTDRQQELQREVDGYSAPGNLERRARELGMVPGGNPAFLDPNGKIRGTTDPATAEPKPPRAANSAPQPAGSPAGSPSGTPSGAPSVPPSGSPSAEPSGASAPKPSSPSPAARTGAEPTPSTTAR
ncbi:cell division protein FtsL [Streptomyces sp. LHD-70]|uniref:cell division protein FtsL n=1 Tax=Streptomyces sp. LHD-70 TaxID=3072140 RepID=UPI00280D5565|nr:cell division protein FtsL [Streptomyces sp. LHD-70]MDQ8701503.1 cell division protein FtsL [Streptomyces sp. LHD-70]